MSDRDLKDFFHVLLCDLGRLDAEIAVSVVTVKLQMQLERLNAKRDVAPVVAKALRYEDDGDLLYYVPAVRR